MVLPSPRTLRRKRTEICGELSFGFQSSVAKRIHLECNLVQNECDKMVVIAVDEMSIKSKGAYQ